MDFNALTNNLYRRDFDCTEVSAQCTVKNSVYGYRPSIAWNSLFLALFALSAITHVGQGIRYRTWSFLGAMAIGGFAEAVGEFTHLAFPTLTSFNQQYISISHAKLNNQIQ
jgi:hypothetical protein